MNDSSSSEYESTKESASEDLTIHPMKESQESEQASHLIRWFVIFVSLWQTIFTISDKAVGLLMKFIVAFIQLLASLTSIDFIAAIASGLPATIHLLRKHVKSDSNTDSVVNFVVCPTCYTLYKFEDCFVKDASGEKLPKNCRHVPFPKYPQRRYRIPCNTPLLKKVHMSGGRMKYIPRYTYTYQPIRASLQRLLNQPGFANQLEHWRTRQCKDGYMFDVYDGQIWKDFNSDKYSNFLKCKRCFGAMLNFDFFQPYKHTPESYGVFYVTLMNLKRDQRFKRENVLLVGIIPAFEQEPSTLNSFLQPLVEELKQFWNPGVRLYTAESPKFRLQFRLALMCVACDIPAARKVCGFIGHSAHLGCSRCLKKFPGRFNLPHDFSGFDRDAWPCRDLSRHKETCENLKKCKTQTEITTMETQTGIKYSILTELPCFDPIRFTIVDPMHNLFLGTAKRVMKKIWLENEVISKESMKVIQSRVDSIQAPSDIGRIPRKIASSFSSFTAEQWKNWVLLYSMFALRGIIPQEHYICWQAFVLSCFFLCQKEISFHDLQKADLLLIKFCRHVENLYGNLAITPNMHLHGHIAECVKDYGPIYGFWLFSFERYNGILGNYPTNKRNTTCQLMARFLREVDCIHLTQPTLYKEYFKNYFPISSFPIEDHDHILKLPTRYFDTLSVSLPSISKFTTLNTSDFGKLKAVYSIINDGSPDEMVRTIRVYKTIMVFNRRLGSLKSPSTKNSSYIMARWADESGNIAETSGIMRPGRVLFFFSHSYKDDKGEYSTNLFASVYWYAEHTSHSLYGKPLEIWKNSYIPEGPAMFLPIEKLSYRCISAQGTIPLPGGREERVAFISPIPGLKFH